MTTQRASPAVIPPIALRDLLRKVRAKMKPNPRLRLPYDPDTEDIWKYYKVIKITPVVIDKLLVILLTIPIIDSTLELNVYHAHNLPAIPPGQKIATKYLFEVDYFANGKHGVYAALPNERSIQVCLESDLAICMMGQALYPMMHITWCIYALFMEDEARVQWDCQYEVKPFLDNRAQSLSRYMWAISSIEQEQLQIRCLEETQVIQIRPPLQVVYIGNGCEGYSPSMYIPAKSELSGTEEIESRKEYFLKFNYVYQQDGLVGVWWQFRSNFVEKVEPLGTMDYSILSQQLKKLDNKYPWSPPVPPMALVVGIGFVLTLLGGVVFAIKLSSGNNRKRGKGNSQDSNYSAPVMLQVYSKVISPGQDSGDRANQPSWPRRWWYQGTTEGGTRSAPNTDEGHPADSPTRLENRHQVREIFGPASQATRTRRAQLPPPKYWSWRHLEPPTEAPVCKAVHWDSSL